MVSSRAGVLRPLPAPPPRLEAEPIAAIDVGSNSIKLLVARPGDDGSLEVLAREKAMVRLGHETLKTGRLSEEAIAGGVACLTRFAALARASGAGRIVCAATCAVREAANGAELARRVKEAADLDLEVISGEEEARLVLRAVRNDVPRSADPLLVIDIGGGSTEIVVSQGRKVLVAESLELGAVRLSEVFVTADPVPREQVKALRDEVRARAGRVAKAIRAAGVKTVIGTSGTIAQLAALEAGLAGRAIPPAGRGTVTAAGLSRVVKELVRTTLRDKLKLPGVEARRADLLVAGGLLLQALMTQLGVSRLEASDRSLRDGLLLDALDKAGVPEADPDADVRRESVGRLLRRSGTDERHAVTTVRFALHLFDRTHALHQLADREREWLEHAARLHDIGWSVGYAGHHRHSAYLITHGGLKGFSEDEVSVIAQVARYHRKGRPKSTHDAFARLDPWLRPVVEKLSALLRLADSLDRTHRQIVTDVEVSVRRRRVVLSLHVSGNPELEVWALQKKSDLFERVFGRRVEAMVENVVRTGAAEAPSGKGRLLPVPLEFPAPGEPS